MKKFLSILVLIVAAGFVFNSCSGDEEDTSGGTQRIEGYTYYVQNHNLKNLDITCIILENRWNTGQIQACRLLDEYTYPETITFSGSNVTIAKFKESFAAPLNGTWRYEYDNEYDVHILRNGSEYIIFW